MFSHNIYVKTQNLMTTICFFFFWLYLKLRSNLFVLITETNLFVSNTSRHYDLLIHKQTSASLVKI